MGDRRDLLHAGAAGLVCFIAYAATLAPSLYWGDSPELSVAAYFAGVPHPTGYPLYMMLAHPWVKYGFFATPAWRMNLASALSAAVAIALLFLLLRRWNIERPAVWSASLTAAFGLTLWSQAVVAEVYAFHLLLCLLVLLRWRIWDETGRRIDLYLACGVWGLSLTHHLMAVLLAPALFYLALTSSHRGTLLQAAPGAAAALLAPALLYLYIPIAALRDTPANWGDAQTLPNLIEHVTGAQFRDRMFRKSPGELLAAAVRLVRPSTEIEQSYMFSQYWWPVYVAAAGGVVLLLREQRRLLGLILLAAGAVLVYAMNYGIDDIEVYYILPHVLVAALAGICGGGLIRRLGHARGAGAARLAAGALFLLPAVTAARNLHRNDRSEWWVTDAMARASLNLLEPNSLVIGGFDNSYFPALYLHHVEGVRPDISLVQAFDLPYPQRTRIITRLSRPGLEVTAPPGFAGSGREARWDNPFLGHLVQQQLPKRPVYLLGVPPGMLGAGWLRGAGTGTVAYAPWNAPLMRLLPAAPDLTGPSPEGPGGLTFYSGDGARRPLLTLHGVEIGSRLDGGLTWWDLNLQWRIHAPEEVARLQIRPTFADATGRYATEADGSPEMHAFHPPGMIYHGEKNLKRGVMVEKLRLYAPPPAWGVELFLWLAISDGERFLPTDGQTWTKLTALPVAPRPDFARNPLRFPGR